MTNRERFRRMTDEELAHEFESKWFTEDCTNCPLLQNKCCGLWNEKNCKESFLNWLRSELDETKDRASMAQTAEQRAEILIKATYDILKKCEESPYLSDILSVTATWDDAECDGSCLKDDIVAWFSEYRGIELEHWNGIRKES